MITMYCFVNIKFTESLEDYSKIFCIDILKKIAIRIFRYKEYV